MTDPFADVRDKRMSELNTEQQDRAAELWLRTNLNSGSAYWVAHVRTLLRVIDRLRREAAGPHVGQAQYGIVDRQEDAA